LEGWVCPLITDPDIDGRREVITGFDIPFGGIVGAALFPPCRPETGPHLIADAWVGIANVDPVSFYDRAHAFEFGCMIWMAGLQCQDIGLPQSKATVSGVSGHGRTFFVAPLQWTQGGFVGLEDT